MTTQQPRWDIDNARSLTDFAGAMRGSQTGMDARRGAPVMACPLQSDATTQTRRLAPTRRAGQ